MSKRKKKRSLRPQNPRRAAPVRSSSEQKTDRHFYEKLEIENFRGIKSLKIDALERVNLFVGKNNCGKTSVLESAFLLIGMSNPSLLVRIENWRGLVLNESSDLKNFFYDQKHNKGFRLSGKQKTESRELNVVPVYGDFDVGQVAPVPSNGTGTTRDGDTIQPDIILSTATEQSLIGLKSKFFLQSRVDNKNQKGRQHEATIRFIKSEDTQFHIEPSKKYEESTLARFLQYDSYYSNSVDVMLNEKRKDLILQCLQSIESKVQDIRTGMNGLVMVDIGMDNFLPINHLGGGIVRILNILAYIYSVRNGMLMIDEVENGLHVSSIKYMWDMVLESSKQTNAQILMTTHSNDVIKGLRMALQDKTDSVACFWLDKFDDDRVKAYRYSPEELESALDAGLDIRH